MKRPVTLVLAATLLVSAPVFAAAAIAVQGVAPASREMRSRQENAETIAGMTTVAMTIGGNDQPRQRSWHDRGNHRAMPVTTVAAMIAATIA